MQALSETRPGEVCMIKWMLGSQELLDFMREHHVREGSQIQVLQSLGGSVIVGAEGERIALSREAADRIKV